MKKILNFVLMIGVFFISFNTSANLKCYVNSANELYPSSNLSNHTLPLQKNIATDNNPKIASSRLIYCNESGGNISVTNALASAKMAVLRPFEASNISQQQMISVSGLNFYKIVNTTNSFLNSHAYIYFRYRDNNDSRPVSTLDVIEGSILGTNNYSQGIQVLDLKLAFTEAPRTEVNNVAVNLGKMVVSWIKPDGYSDAYTTSFEQSIGLNLTIKPNLINTCDVKNNTVYLPTIMTSALKDEGSIAGITQFEVRAICPTGKLEKLEAVIFDNQDISSSDKNYALKGLLKNTNSSTKNIAIQITDSSTFKPVILGEIHNFGDIQSLLSEKKHIYYANYYKTNSDPTLPGLVKSTATIVLTYK